MAIRTTAGAALSHFRLGGRLLDLAGRTEVSRPDVHSDRGIAIGLQDLDQKLLRQWLKCRHPAGMNDVLLLGGCL